MPGERVPFANKEQHRDLNAPEVLGAEPVGPPWRMEWVRVADQPLCVGTLGEQARYPAAHRPARKNHVFGEVFTNPVERGLVHGDQGGCSIRSASTLGHVAVLEGHHGVAVCSQSVSEEGNERMVLSRPGSVCQQDCWEKVAFHEASCHGSVVSPFDHYVAHGPRVPSAKNRAAPTIVRMLATDNLMDEAELCCREIETGCT